ncbi:hypothetical protein A1D29_07625 [Pasteurellaceae bacterium Orientalotternb1]|nr:hypothetical protein A1D29_07625 [Pasteurellaceae bacterium Orientalotternb1]
MFSRINQIIYGGLAAVILGLGSWLWIQGQVLSSLKAENQTQAQTISQLEQNQERLNQQLIAEQQAVEKQQRIANELKAKSEQSREKVRIILQKEPCANTAMPSDVTDSIKRLHHKGKD